MDLPEKIAALREKTEKQEHEIHEVSKKIESVYPKISEVQKNFETILSEIERFEKAIQNFERNYRETEGKIEQFKKVLDSKISEINSGFNSVSQKTDEKLGRVIEQIGDASKRISNTEARGLKEIDTIKVNFAELKKEFDELGETLDEVSTDLAQSAKNEQLHKHYADLKMDLATTAGKYDKQLESVSNEISEIKSEMSNFSKIKDLEDTDISLLKRVKEIEMRVDTDLNEIVKEFKEFGRIFAKKEDVRDLINKETQEILGAESTFAEFEQNQQTSNQRMTGELAEHFRLMEHLRSELNMLREQVIVTQNAIVEMNTFLRQQFQ